MPPPPSSILEEDEVRVWRASLDPPEARLAALQALLTGDELRRARRFILRRDRSRFAAGRALLRAVLGMLLEAPPRSLRFEYGPRGKPALAGMEQPPLHFNLSHSHGLALLAVARRVVGVDLEQVREVIRMETIARRYFSDQENAELRALPPEARQAAFFRCWTRKEAYVKARGEGLAFPLRDFTVSLDPERAALLDVKGDSEEARRWSLWNLSPAAGYAGALAVAGSGLRVRQMAWEWEECDDG